MTADSAKSGNQRRRGTVLPLTRRLRVATLASPVQDRRYQADTPLGGIVAAYLDWKQSEWGALESTLRDYEIPLAYLCRHHPRLELADFEPPAGKDRIRAFIAHFWGDRAPRTRLKNHSILSDFFKWCRKEGLMIGDPMLGISRPRKRDVERNVYSPGEVERIIVACDRPRDRCATRILAEFGLRKSELSHIQLQDYDADRRLLRVTGKGQKKRTLPVVSPALIADLETHWRERLDVEGGTVDEYLLYPEKYGLAWAHGRAKTLLWEDRRKPLLPTPMHRWWKLRLAAAGVPLVRKMHEMRHTAATDLLRDSGNLELVRQMLGHANIQTTAMYSHLDVNDLAAALAHLSEQRKQAG